MASINITVQSTATKFIWWMLNYPVSNECYYKLLNDSEKILAEGNHTIPQNVIDNWGTDDSVIENHLIENQVWNS